jgi:hypothetical protein
VRNINKSPIKNVQVRNINKSPNKNVQVQCQAQESSSGL